MERFRNLLVTVWTPDCEVVKRHLTCSQRRHERLDINEQLSLFRLMTVPLQTVVMHIFIFITCISFLIPFASAQNVFVHVNRTSQISDSDWSPSDLIPGDYNSLKPPSPYKSGKPLEVGISLVVSQLMRVVEADEVSHFNLSVANSDISLRKNRVTSCDASSRRSGWMSDWCSQRRKAVIASS
jgi:hypothetical protein